MSIVLDDITRRKLILVRQLYQRALLQSETPYSYVDRILALIGFDLTNETLLRVVVVTLDVLNSPTGSFQQIVKDADNLLSAAQLPPIPDKARIQRIRTLRNDAQHKAKYPNETDLSDARTYTRDFLEQIIFNVWGEKFETISLTDIINDVKGKTYLKEAETALANSDYKEAVIKSMAALEWTIDEVKDSIVGRIPYSFKAFVVVDGWGETQKSTEVFKVFEHMRKLLMRSMIGMTLPEYLRYDQVSQSFVQGISFSEDGHFNVNLANRDPDKASADYIVTFVVNAVLQIERLVGDINKPFVL